MSHVWRGGRWWVAALVLLNLSLHLPISDVFDGFARRYGFTEYNTATHAVSLTSGAAFTVWLLLPSPVNARVRPALACLGLVIATAQTLIVVNGIEAIHYPQFALMAWLLTRSGVGLERAWLTSTALGAFDEIWQWQTLPRAVPGYLDWNDIVLNAIGAALGLLVAVRLRGAVVDPRVLPNRVLAGAIAVAAVVALMAGPVIERPFFRLTPGGRWFHLLSPFEAVVSLAVIWGITRLLTRGPRLHPSP